MTTRAKAAPLEQIRVNIAKFGCHVYVVPSGPLPRYAYTIGLTPDVSFELILAGGKFYSLDAVGQIINDAARLVLAKKAGEVPPSLQIDSLPGTFSFYPVHASWSAELMLGTAGRRFRLAGESTTSRRKGRSAFAFETLECKAASPLRVQYVFFSLTRCPLVSRTEAPSCARGYLRRIYEKADAQGKCIMKGDSSCMTPDSYSLFSKTTVRILD